MSCPRIRTQPPSSESLGAPFLKTRFVSVTLRAVTVSRRNAADMVSVVHALEKAPAPARAAAAGSRTHGPTEGPAMDT